MSINQSYEWLMEGRYKLNTSTFYSSTTSQKPFSPAIDFDGDGKLSAEEWKRMNNLKLEESARAFYNLLLTSLEFKIWVEVILFLCVFYDFGFIFLVVGFGNWRNSGFYSK